MPTFDHMLELFGPSVIVLDVQRGNQAPEGVEPGFPPIARFVDHREASRGLTEDLTLVQFEKGGLNAPRKARGQVRLVDLDHARSQQVDHSDWLLEGAQGRLLSPPLAQVQADADGKLIMPGVQLEDAAIDQRKMVDGGTGIRRVPVT